MRGKRPCRRPRRRKRRSIPACAGETRPPGSNTRQTSVYPRVCGGNIVRPIGEVAQQGLSPRVRGKRRAHKIITGKTGSIPACAGETPWPAIGGGGPMVYPRVCGGNCRRPLIACRRPGLSPRVRGKPARASGFPAGIRSIPACAGETVSVIRHGRVTRVYPRVCGGNCPPSRVSLALQGLSPRVRGKRK